MTVPIANQLSSMHFDAIENSYYVKNKTSLVNIGHSLNPFKNRFFPKYISRDLNEILSLKKFWNKQNDARTYLETMVNDFYANSLKWNRIESRFENHRVANFFIQPVKLQIPREVLIWGYRHQYIYRISSIWIIFSS